jgi:hypothetical protein
MAVCWPTGRGQMNRSVVAVTIPGYGAELRRGHTTLAGRVVFHRYPASLFQRGGLGPAGEEAAPVLGCGRRLGGSAQVATRERAPPVCRGPAGRVRVECGGWVL